MIGESLQGYEIKQAICFDNNCGFVLAENPCAVQPFVTWQFAEYNGTKNFCWGNYFLKQKSSVLDFEMRVKEYKKDNPTLNEKYNYLAAAEMSGEDNYNQIDGIPNNGFKPSILNQIREFTPTPSDSDGKSGKPQVAER